MTDDLAALREQLDRKEAPDDVIKTVDLIIRWTQGQLDEATAVVIEAADRLVHWSERQLAEKQGEPH